MPPPGQSGYRTMAQYRASLPSRDDDPFAASMPGGPAQTSARLESIQRKRKGFALFHDGNAGHLWRGEVASLLGESVLTVGVVIWLAYLTSSPLVVFFALVALGLPWLVAVPIAPFLENMREPGKPLAWAGRLRVVAALGLVGMHFYTIYPVLYGLLLAIGLLGRARQSLRVAATKTCLEPGEIELVTNDLFTGSALVTVVGPLLAAALFVVMGERVILVGLAAAALFLLASNSDGFLDALPPERRAFNLATTVSATPDEAARADLLAAARENLDDARDGADNIAGAAVVGPMDAEQRERALPEWYQQGPANPFQAVWDVRAGLRLAGGRAASASALMTLCALALAGGGMSVLEVFYLTVQLGLPGYYLGALVAIEAGGMTLGALFSDSRLGRGLGAPLTLFSLALNGVALVALGVTTSPLPVYGIALGLGVANGICVVATRRLLRVGRDGAERRALGAGEAVMTALASIVGGALFTAAYNGFSRARIGSHVLFPGLPISLIISGAGVGLIATALILLVAPGLRERELKVGAASGKTDPDAELSAKIASLPGSSGRYRKPEPKAKNSKKGKQGATAQAGAVGALWGDDADSDDGDLDTGYRGARGYDSPDDGGYDDDQYPDDRFDGDQEDGDDWGRPARGRGAPPPRPDPRDRRGRR